MKQTLVILDTHAILHRGYHALPEFSSSKGEPTGALYGLVLMLLSIDEKIKPTHIAAAFDLPKPTHRHIAFKGYKAQRIKTDDALIAQINRARDVLKAFGVPIYEAEGFEADDVLGTIVDKLSKDKKTDIVIASGDMDTLQLVSGEKVRVYTLRKGVKDTVLYDEKAVVARYGFGPLMIPDYKGLRGDPSDNIPGVAGIGEKGATELISKFGTVEAIYKALHDAEKKGKDIDIKDSLKTKLISGEEDALFSKVLATIRRDAPIAFDMKEAVWDMAAHRSDILAICKELEFRSMVSRFSGTGSSSVSGAHTAEQKSIKTIDKKNLKKKSKKDVDETLEDVESQEGGAHKQQHGLFDTPKTAEEIALLRRAGIALWVLDSNYTNPSEEEILEYTKAETVSDALAHIEKKIDEVGLNRVYCEIEIPLMPVITDMEQKGIAIDTEVLKKISKTLHEELDIVSKKIFKEAGSTFNINSPRQLGKVLYEDLGLGAKVKKTSTGAKSTNEAELEKIKEFHPVVALVLDYRELQKLLSTYIDVIPDLVASDGRLHATFMQNGAATGRMSSQNPNLQNIPIKTERGRKIRDAFVASPGKVLLECDYSQVELRVAAFLSGDEKLMDIFKHGRDVHTEVASQVFGIPSDQVTKEMRRQAKVINFGILYGMGVNALKGNLGTTRDEARKFYDAYFATFSKLATYLEEVKATAAVKGYTETLLGRRRPMSGLKSPFPQIRAQAERMAINAPIQGTASDLIKLAMIEVFNKVCNKGQNTKVHMVLQIHDSLMFEVDKDAVKDVAREIVDCMSHCFSPSMTKGVPIEVHAEYGPHWGALQSI